MFILLPSFAEAKAKQSKAKQSKAKQSKAKAKRAPNLGVVAGNKVVFDSVDTCVDPQ